MTPAYFVINEQNGQLNSEFDYPYTASIGDYAFDSSKAIRKITSLIGVEGGNEINLRDKIAQYRVVFFIYCIIIFFIYYYHFIKKLKYVILHQHIIFEH